MTRHRDSPHLPPPPKLLALAPGPAQHCTFIQYLQQRETAQKLEVWAEAAKYDASCTSSGAPKLCSRGTDGVGASTGAGICDSFTPDGPCMSLLKILLTHFCSYDCQYCVNRRSSNVPHACFAPDELIDLTLDFYRRNYIDSLLLGSGIIQSSSYTQKGSDGITSAECPS